MLLFFNHSSYISYLLQIIIIIETIHGTRFGDTFYGTENYEKFFANGGDNILNMGGGDDRVSYASGNSKDYTITLVGDEIHVTGPTTKDIIIGGRYVEFMADNKIIDTDYLKQPITATFIKTIYSFDFICLYFSCSCYFFSVQ